MRTTSTRERLSSAATAGTLDGRDARTLAEAHDLFWRLRLEHQVEQMRQGAEPDDYIDIGKLNPLTRRYLREAFHAVSAVQRSLRGRARPSSMRLLRPRRRRSAAASAYQAAKPPPPATPWREARYAVVDLETTGLDPRRDEIVSFASIPIEDGRVIVGGTRTAIVRPARMPEAETIRIHGLRPADLADAAMLPEVLDLMLESLTGRVLVAHVAWVERGFLAAALKRAGLRLAEPVLDTSILARHVLAPEELGDGQALSLADVARALGLPVHSPHVAEGDALTTAQLFLALATHLDRIEPQTVGSLARLSRG